MPCRKIRSAARRTKTRGKSWVPDQKGQSVEGSATATVVPPAKAPMPLAQNAARSKPENDAAREEKIDRDADYSPSLPSREKIAKVLR